jgi:hypothetical protein
MHERRSEPRGGKGLIKTRVGRGTVKGLVWVGDPVVRVVAGKKGSPLGLLQHRGRKTGVWHATVTGVAEVEDGFAIPWVFESHSQWYRNVWAANGCRLSWGGKNYELKDPEIVDAGRALGAFPLLLRLMYKGMGVDEFVLLHRTK